MLADMLTDNTGRPAEQEELALSSPEYGTAAAQSLSCCTSWGRAKLHHCPPTDSVRLSFTPAGLRMHGAVETKAWQNVLTNAASILVARGNKRRQAYPANRASVARIALLHR